MTDSIRPEDPAQFARQHAQAWLRVQICEAAHDVGLPLLAQGTAPDALAVYLVGIVEAGVDVQLGRMSVDAAVEQVVMPGLLDATEQCSAAGATHFAGRALSVPIGGAVRLVVELSLRRVLNAYRSARAAHARAEAVSAVCEAFCRQLAQARHAMVAESNERLDRREKSLVRAARLLEQARLDTIGAGAFGAFSEGLNAIREAYGLPGRFATSDEYADWLFASKEPFVLGEF